MKTVRKDLKSRMMNILEFLSVTAFAVTALLHNTKGNVSIVVPMFLSIIVVVLCCYELFNRKPIKR